VPSEFFLSKMSIFVPGSYIYVLLFHFNCIENDLYIAIRVQLLNLHIPLFAHFIVLHFLFHCTFYFYFSFFTIYMLLCCYFYIIFICILLHCPLSGPDFTYISLLIIPFIIYYLKFQMALIGSLCIDPKPLNSSVYVLNITI